MKVKHLWGQILQNFAGGNDCSTQGILSQSEFRRILAFERALADRHDRHFSMLIYSADAEQPAPLLHAKLIQLLQGRLRETDVVGWLDGDRVGVILPYSAPGGARALADDVCARLNACALPTHCEIHSYPSEETHVDNCGDGTAGVGRAESSTIRAGSPQVTLALLTQPLPKYKRAFDLLIAVTGLILAAPLMAVIAGSIALVSPGPIFFRQERVGYLGRRFTCWKFRTMRVASDHTVHLQYCRALMQTDGPMTKLDDRGDARLIPIGKLLRASGLDELPQLYNVLCGEMSITGPRPCLQSEYEGYQRWHKRRFDALPGLTGLWQVSGKNRTTFSQMMRLDVTYARSQALHRDVEIVWRTLPVLVEQVQRLLAQRAESRESSKRLRSVDAISVGLSHMARSRFHK